jgi:hypothetical protein
MQGLMLRGSSYRSSGQLAFQGFDKQAYDQLHTTWDNVAEKERMSRTMFAQRGLDVSEVAAQWQAMRAAIGTHVDVARFVQDAIIAHDGSVGRYSDRIEIHVPNRAAIRDIFDKKERISARFELPVSDGVHYLARTHPYVEGLANHVMDAALDPLLVGEARRCGVIRTRAVSATTTLLLLRYRYHIVRLSGEEETPLLAEESDIVGFQGRSESPRWLGKEEAEALLAAEPDENVSPADASRFIARILDGFPALQEALNRRIQQRGDELLEAHRRVRTASRLTGVRYRVEPQLPPDVLGVYLLLPAGGGA